MNDSRLLVEATIDAVFTDPIGKEVRIQLTSAWEPKERMEFIATGVDDFVANEMRLSNVVESVKWHDAAGLDAEPTEVAERIFFLMRGREPSKGELEWDILSGKLERIRSGELLFLEIQPVYGASLLILASKIELRTSTEGSATANATK